MADLTDHERFIARVMALGPAAVILLTVFIGLYFYAMHVMDLAHAEHMRCLDALLPE